MRKEFLFKAFVYVLGCGLSFAACSSDDDDKSDGNKKWLLSKVQSDESDIFIEYDSSNRIVKAKEVIKSTNPESGEVSEAYFNSSYEYDQEGKLAKRIVTIDEGRGVTTDTYMYTYAADTVYKVKEGADYISAKLVVNSKGQVLKRLSNSSVTTYEYDEAGNLLKSVETSGSGSYTEKYISVDKHDLSKKSPICHVNLPSWMIVSEIDCVDMGTQNPIIHNTYERESYDPKYSYTYINTLDYTYNEYNQPIELRGTYDHGDRGVSNSVGTFTYVEVK